MRRRPRLPTGSAGCRCPCPAMAGGKADGEEGRRRRHLSHRPGRHLLRLVGSRKNKEKIKEEVRAIDEQLNSVLQETEEINVSGLHAGRSRAGRFAICPMAGACGNSTWKWARCRGRWRSSARRTFRWPRPMPDFPAAAAAAAAEAGRGTVNAEQKKPRCPAGASSKRRPRRPRCDFMPETRKRRRR